MAERESQRKEMEELKDGTKSLEEELVHAREDRNKAVAISRKFHDFIGHPGNIVNKTQLYDKSTGQPGSSSRPKTIWCMVDYSTKIEKLLKEICTLLQPVGQQPEPKPATQQAAPKLIEQQPPAPATTLVAQPKECAIPTRRQDPTL